MIKASATRLLLCGVLAVAGGLASLQPADAAPARVRFTPPYGTPFPNLEWFGEAVIDDGSCAASGTISNLVGGCAGQFSITSATVYFADVSAPTVPLGHIDFNGGQVVQGTGTHSPDEFHLSQYGCGPRGVGALIEPVGQRCSFGLFADELYQRRCVQIDHRRSLTFPRREGVPERR